MSPWMRTLTANLGKQAADAVRKRTVKSGTMPAGTPEAKAALSAADLNPAAHVAPTRYGRKPYSRGTDRDST